MHPVAFSAEAVAEPVIVPVIEPVAGRPLSAARPGHREAQSSRAWIQCLALVLIYSATFLFLAGALRVRYGFPLDDSYIHQTVARNLADYGIPGFIPRQRSSGATSLIWTYVQAANDRFLHFDPVAYNLGIGWVLLASIGPLLFTLARRDGLPARTCWLLAATPPLCGNFLWLGLIGMEHLLFVALSLASVYFWFSRPLTGRWSWPSACLAGLAAGLLAITRPEAMVFAPLLLVASAVMLPKGQRRPAGQIAVLLGFWVFFLALILAANRYTSHSWMPATLKGRTWLYFHTSGGPHSVESVVRFLGSWVQKLPRMFSTRWVGQMSTLGDVRGSFAVAGFLLTALALLGLAVLATMRSIRVRFLLLWAVAHFAIYLATFPSAGHGGRYQPLTLLLAFPCFAFGLLWLLERAASALDRPFTRNLPVALTVVAMIAAGASSLLTWRTVAIDGIGHIDDTHARIALWLKRHAPPNAKIAAFDIGRISYDWGHGITDLGGLVDPSYYPYLVAGRVPAYLEAKHIEYLVLPSAGTEDFGFRNSSLGMVKVAEFCSPRAPWLIGWRYTIHATQCQELYRLSYPARAQP